MTNASNEFVADKVLDKGQRAPGGENTTRPSGQPIATENTSITAVSYTHLTLPTKRIA